MKLLSILLCLVITVNAFGQKTINLSKQALLTSKGQKISSDYTDEAFKALTSAEPNRLYSLVIRDMEKTETKVAVNLANAVKAGYSVYPLRAYTFDWNKLSLGDTKGNVNTLIVDSLHLVCIAVKKEKILGIVVAGIKNGKWHVYSEIPNVKDDKSTLQNNSDQDDISIVKAVKLARQSTPDIFSITYTDPKDSFAEFVIGFVLNNKASVITFHSGVPKKIDNIDDWVKNDSWLKNYHGKLFDQK